MGFERALLMGSRVGRNMRRARAASRIDRFFGSSMDAGFVVVTTGTFSFCCAYPKPVFLRLYPSQPAVESLLSTSGTPTAMLGTIFDRNQITNLRPYPSPMSHAFILVNASPELYLRLPPPSIAQTRPPCHHKHTQGDYQYAPQIRHHRLLAHLFQHFTANGNANERAKITYQPWTRILSPRIANHSRQTDDGITNPKPTPDFACFRDLPNAGWREAQERSRREPENATEDVQAG